MKPVYFEKVSILSEREKKGFYYKFSPSVNIIHGDNDTGKSSLIKSLYYTLGGDLRIDETWSKEDIKTRVDIVVGDKKYAFFRHKKIKSVFEILNNDIKCLLSTTSTRELAEVVGEIFGFNLQLALKQTGELQLANPACLYLPFYIDQDEGWHNILGSFSGMQMYHQWQSLTVQYHAGIKSAEYYELLGKIRVLKLDIEELQQRQKSTLAAQEKVESSLGSIFFDIDLNDYKQQLNHFVKECEKLYVEESKFRLSLIKVLERRSAISDEIESCKASLGELDSEPFHSNTNVTEKYLRFNRESEVLKALEALHIAKNDIDKEIEELNSNLENSKSLSMQLKDKLTEVKEDLTIHDIIKSQANKEIKATFEDQLHTLQMSINEKLGEQDHLEQRKKEIASKKKSEYINNTFKGLLKSAQDELDIDQPIIGPVTNHSKITKRTGSRSPRAIFSYHYSLLLTMKKHSKTMVLPIVIDSPKQQDLDKKETEKVITLCTRDLAKIGQVIVGASSLEDNMHGYNTLELSEKYSLLKKEIYDLANQEIMPLALAPYTATTI